MFVPTVANEMWQSIVIIWNLKAFDKVDGYVSSYNPYGSSR